jgi:dihydroneopterin aldolase
MVFFGRHGVLASERELGQRFIVDVEMGLDLRPAGVSDDLTETVDYSEVHRRVREIVEGEPFDLIEAVAERVALSILQSHPKIETVRVKVKKPDVRLEGTVLGGSAVEILRHRSF